MTIFKLTIWNQLTVKTAVHYGYNAAVKYSQYCFSWQLQ